MTSDRIIKAGMVLAAGFGTRMRPLTDAMPKPLVKLGGRALLDHALDRLAAAGVERAVVNVHHFADQIEAHLKGRAAPHIIVSDERNSILETGGGVLKALPYLDDDVFAVHNADSVWHETGRANLLHLFRTFEQPRMAALLLLARIDSSIGYTGRGDFAMNESGRLARRKPGEDTDYVFAGVSVLSARLFDGIEEDRFSLNRIFDRAAAEGKLYGVVLEGVWMHVGTPDALAEAESFLNGARRKTA